MSSSSEIRCPGTVESSEHGAEDPVQHQGGDRGRQPESIGILLEELAAPDGVPLALDLGRQPQPAAPAVRKSRVADRFGNPWAG
jgi:hypothetical protein